MSELTTFIKLDRNILNWGWYKDGNTMRLFLHLLLTVNIADKWHKDLFVHRGSMPTSYEKLASETGMTVKEVRTALSHLKRTNEVAYTSSRKGTVISIKNYDKYQQGAYKRANEGQTLGKQGANEGQLLNKYNNYNKENKENCAPAPNPEDDEMERIRRLAR